MTGWRIGYLTGPAPMPGVMAVIQEQMASCVNAATQRAAIRHPRPAGLRRDDAAGLPAAP